MLKRLVLTMMAMLIVSSQAESAVMTLSVNGEPVADAESGAPVIVSATLTDRAGVAAPEWQLTVVDASGAPVPVGAVLRRKQDPERVGPFSTCSAVWTIAAEEIAALPLGEYRLRVGESKPARLRIVAAAETEDVEKKTAKLLLLSEAAELEGKLDEAIQSADAILAFDAESIAARLRKAGILSGKGDLTGALTLLDEAEQLSVRRFPGEHPPVLIRVRQAEILSAMEARTK